MAATPSTSVAAGAGGTETAGAAGAAGADGIAAAPAAGHAGSAGGMSAQQAGSGGQGGAGGAGGALPNGGMGGATESCLEGTVAAEEVIFIGESFIAQSGAIPRYTTQLARDAGAVGMNESYRSYAVSGTQLTTGDIPDQYTRAKGDGPVKVVLMDGGGNDLLWGGYCTNGPASCEDVVRVVEMLFEQMGTDGVEDVVYFFYPDPVGIGASIKAPMDTLRPEMKKLCDGATDVRCIWVDQRESWMGHYDEYTSDGIHPTSAGSMASSQQIWDAMVAHCVAQ